MAKDPKHERIRKAWGKFLAGYPLQWVAHLSFRRVPRAEDAKERLKLWTRDICRGEGLRVASLSIYNELNRAHIHSLLLSKPSPEEKTLKDVSPSKWASNWQNTKYTPDIMDFMGGTAEVEEIYDLEGIGDYLASNVTIKRPEKSDIWYYDLELLGSYKSASLPADAAKMSPEELMEKVKKGEIDLFE
ncbi:hypothetical protein EG832_18360 [bacterium]|nr:hypothetical protein [bacterium]